MLSNNPRKIASAIILLFVIASIAAVVSADSSRFAVSHTTSIEKGDDGNWWVVESGHNGEALIFKYDESWTQVDEPRYIETKRRVNDLSNREGGGWWIAQENTVWHYDSNWKRKNNSHKIKNTGIFDIEPVENGGWWIAAGRDFGRYNDSWGKCRSCFDHIDSAHYSGGGYPVASEYESSDRLWILHSHLGRGISWYPLTTEGRYIHNNTKKMVEERDGPFETSRKRVAVAKGGYSGLHQFVDTPVDIEPTKTGGWWVLDRDGQVHRFDKYWRYEGITHQVGTGTARSYYPSDVGTLIGPLIRLLFVSGGWFGPAFLIAIGLLLEFNSGQRKSVFQEGIAGLVFVYGVISWPFFIRPYLFIVPQLPLVVIVIGAGYLLYQYRDKYNTEQDLKPLLLIHGPAVLAALGMIEPALRPF